MSVSVSQILLEHRHTHLFTYCQCLFSHHNDQVFETETVCELQPQIINIQFFIEKVYQPFIPYSEQKVESMCFTKF